MSIVNKGLCLAGSSGEVQVDAAGVVVTPSVAGQIDQQSLNVVLDEQVALRETAATGIVSGGLLTIASPTTVDISAGEGEIVDGYNDRRDPTRINVSWLAIPGVTVTIVSNVGLSYFAIDNLGTLIQQPTPLTPAQRRIMVPIGVVYYNDSVVSAVIQGGVHSNEVGNALYDYVNTKSVSERVTGMGVNPVIGLLQVWSDSGELFAIGINTGISLTDPNIKSFIQVGNSTTPLIFDVLTQDGAVFSTGNTTIPALLELTPNVVTPLGVTPAAIHYLYRDINNEFFLQLGQIEYPNVGDAKASLSVDATTFVNFTGQESMILVAQLYMRGNASNFENGDGGINTSILSGGSSGGVSATDFLDLSDVIPTSYLGEGGRAVIVDPTETGLSFVDSDSVGTIKYREPVDTGVYSGGVITKGAGDLDVSVAIGSGVIVDSITDPFDIATQEISWISQTLAITPIAVDTQEIHNIYIDVNGNLTAVAIQNDDKGFIDNIMLGWAEIKENVIISVSSAPHVIGQTGNNLTDIFRILKDDAVTRGLRIIPSTGLGIYLSAGSMLLPGINWNTDPKHSNVFEVDQQGDDSTPLTINSFNKDAKPVLPASTTLPAYWDNAGVVEPLTAGEAVIHYAFFSALGVSLQLGSTKYANFHAAVNAVDTDKDNFIFAPGAGVSGKSVLLGQIIIRGDSVDFSDKSSALIISTVNGESGATVSPIDHSLVPQYLLKVEAAEALVSGDLLSMDVNGRLQKYPATGGESTNEYTANNVDIHAMTFLDEANNRGVVAWVNDTIGTQINFRVVQRGTDGTVTYSPITTRTTVNPVTEMHLCYIGATLAGIGWITLNGFEIAMIDASNGTSLAPTMGGSQFMYSGSVASCAITHNSSKFVTAYTTGGTFYVRHTDTSGAEVLAPTTSANGAGNGSDLRITFEGTNSIVVTAINGTQSYWREVAWGGNSFSNIGGSWEQIGMAKNGGVEVYNGTILAQFLTSGGVLQTYQATYSSGSQINTPSGYGASIPGESGDLSQSSTGLGYTTVLKTDGSIELYSGSLGGSWSLLSTLTTNVGVTPSSIGATLFGSVFAMGVLGDYTWANDIIFLDSNAVITDHFIAVAPADVAQGEIFNADIALPLITLQREYPVGTIYTYGPYTYQVISPTQSVVILVETV